MFVSIFFNSEKLAPTILNVVTYWFNSPARNRCPSLCHLCPLHGCSSYSAWELTPRFRMSPCRCPLTPLRHLYPVPHTSYLASDSLHWSTSHPSPHTLMAPSPAWALAPQARSSFSFYLDYDFLCQTLPPVSQHPMACLPCVNVFLFPVRLC